MKEEYQRRLEDYLRGVNRKRAEEIRRLFCEVYRDGGIDELTGLDLRREFEERISPALRKSEELGIPFSLILADMDHFKRVNDKGYTDRNGLAHYGHDAGDHLLRDVSYVIQRNLRLGDVACRWGGEEILVVLPHTKVDEAFTVADRLRRHIRLATCQTASFGVTSFPEPTNTTDLDTLIKDADRALYEAKDGGRNMVVVYENTLPCIRKN